MTNAGRIQAHGADIVTSSNSWPCVCDWNDDGKKDLLVGQEGLSGPSNVYVYLNQGEDSLPAFGDSTPVLHGGVPFTDRRTVPVALDLDRDGKKDLILGEWYSSIRFYPNTGTDTNPVFGALTNLVEPDPDSFRNGNPPRLNFADWDGDGDPDMITCDYYGSVFLRRCATTALAEPAGTRSIGAQPATIIARGRLWMPLTATRSPLTGCLRDIAGREVMKLHPGSNGVGCLAPGVYYLQQKPAAPSLNRPEARKVIITG